MGSKRFPILRHVDALQHDLWTRLLEIPGIEEGENSWGDDIALWVNAQQMANFTGDRAIEIRLTRAVIRELTARLKADPRVTLRGRSDWAGFSFASAEDFEYVLEMARCAAKVYLPADVPKPPPIGSAMERRKRFH